MSLRITRSSARLAAYLGPDPDDLAARPAPKSSDITPAKSQKRKISDSREPSPPVAESAEIPPVSTARSSKRLKTADTSLTPSILSPRSTRSSKRKKEAADNTMSGNRSSSKYNDEQPKSSSKSSSRASSGKAYKVSSSDNSPPTQTSVPRKLRKKPFKKDVDADMKDAEVEKPSRKEKTPLRSPTIRHPTSSDAMSPDAPSSDPPDPFSSMFGRGGPSGLSSTLRALSGMMSGMNSRFKDILTNLRRVDDPNMQFVALEELSNLLLVSNEDNLSGQFAPDAYVKELIILMQPNAITGEENPEMMLLACRSLANMMEALRGSVANVVYGGAVPVLCQKLLDIQYIDVAEQALSTLAKISIQYPGSIVREGGLTACLQFLDFFATGTQRTAVTTAANCCRNIPFDSFATIRDVMPILQNVLTSHDQKVVEQGCLCVTRIIDSFKRNPDKVEELVGTPLLQAMLQLLLPGTTNLISANIHTEFLRVLAIVARSSPLLSTELLRLNIVDTLYQILTGISPPEDSPDAAAQIDSVVIMQALIHRPKEQIFEALNVICEIMPRIKLKGSGQLDLDGIYLNPEAEGDRSTSKSSRHKNRLELLQGHESQARRFAVILMPTLTDVYSSTVNLSVRQKVLTAQLKILSNLATKFIEDALRPVPYASFLTSILSQEDHPSLVIFALQASELLLDRLASIYRYQFFREGVVSEIERLAFRTPETESRQTTRKSSKLIHESTSQSVLAASSTDQAEELSSDAEADFDKEDDEVDDDEHDAEDDDDGEETNGEVVIAAEGEMDEEDESDFEHEEILLPMSIPGANDIIKTEAGSILEKLKDGPTDELRKKAACTRIELGQLAEKIKSYYTTNIPMEPTGFNLFEQLAKKFDGDALGSITSFELRDSGVVHHLGQVLASSDAHGSRAREDFAAAFMGTAIDARPKLGSTAAIVTPFSILVSKLQDLLSRSEHFEVLTVSSPANENGRSSSTSVLSRQIRLKLSAGEDSDIPAEYRDIIVSIHAIATFTALDDYLRPRISVSDRPMSVRRKDMLQQLANARMAQLSGAADAGLFSAFSKDITRPAADSSHTSLQSGSETGPSLPIQTKQNESKDQKSDRRRTGRRHKSPDDESRMPGVPAPILRSGQPGDNLEITDEKHVEGTPDRGGGDEALDAILGEVEEASDDDATDPDAVNMEIAASGKVTARLEDGSRVYTPQQPGTPITASQNSSYNATLDSVASTPSAIPKKPGSYAAAAAKPQDWHIEFSIDGKPIPDNITIYRALHHNRDHAKDVPDRSSWSGIHEVKFRKAAGPAPAAKLSTSAIEERERLSEGLPPSLNGHPVTSSILVLLGLLHELNEGVDDLAAGARLHAEPLISFVNTKLTAKMNRQLEEPLIVASNCLPDWSEDLARAFPFLFPFETRHLFLQSTSFGYSRCITRWQNTQSDNDDRRERHRYDRPLMGRVQRQKVRINRSKMFESAMKVMDHFGPSPSVLEVEYFDEVGTGLGPTLEFYSVVSKEFSKKQLKLWRENDTFADDIYAFGKHGLFPAPIDPRDKESETNRKLLQVFKILGTFVARSMLDSRIIDINFSPAFFRNGRSKASITALKAIDQDLANSLTHLQEFARKRTSVLQNDTNEHEEKGALESLTIRGVRLEDLGLDFTLPGYPSIELIENGSNTDVTPDNIDLYIQRVLDLTLDEGVEAQIDAFQKGFSCVFPYSSLKAFTSSELVMLFGKVDEDWSLETLMDSMKADHGFNMDSSSVKNLLTVMSQLSVPARRDFLQFATGSPRLPIGGFKALVPMFTVVCKPSESPYTSDDYLPSVMTCANYLKLPDYSSIDVLREKLSIATREGQGAFHLS